MASGPDPATSRAVLFDLDGTLADTAGDLALALNRVRASRGLAPVDPAPLRVHASSGARGLLQAGMGVSREAADYEALRIAFLAHYEHCLAETSHLFAGIEALLEALDANHVPWGVVTNKAARYAVPVASALGLLRRAHGIVCGDTTPHPKPHPAPLLLAARALGVEPSACLYVGDDLRDVEAGRAAGMRTAVAQWGYLGGDVPWTEWPADGVLASPFATLDWVGDAAADRAADSVNRDRSRR
jgi:phosphoglycolate phosphatase